MFRYLNKIIRRNPLRKMAEAGDRNGQVAVILILVVAAALIFYAVTLNMGRLNQNKIITTIAADTGAALLGSYMASYGQQVFQVSLGGHKRIEGYTGVLMSIVTVVIAVVAIVALGPGALTIASLVLSLGGLALQVAVIQPGITTAANDMLGRSMDSKDVYIEQGIKTALSIAATDRVQVADLNDSDGDRVWGFDTRGEPLDNVSRFGVYYAEQRANTMPPPLTTAIDDFLDHLRDFLIKDTDDWGIYDDTGPNCTPFAQSSECNPCCVPGDRDPESGELIYRSPEIDCDNDPSTSPLDPDNPDNEEFIEDFCAARSPYGDGTASDYPWVFDPFYGNPSNNNTFISFQEQIGRDDEHKGFSKRPASPNGIQDATPPPPTQTFKLKDTTGFYTAPVYPGAEATDQKPGIYPFFYKIADWGVNLDPAVLVTNSWTNPQCHWCTTDSPSNTTCHPTNHPREIPQLVLPVSPATLSRNTTYCVDGTTGRVAGNADPPLAVDLIRPPDPLDPIFAANPLIGIIPATLNQCSEYALGRAEIGIWKRGGDRFCASNSPRTPPYPWPYYGECAKYGSCPEDNGEGGTVDIGCRCGQAGAQQADNWPDDLLDNILYGLNSFLGEWALDFVQQDPVLLGREFSNWYPEAADWIEAGTSADPRIGSLASNDLNTCQNTSCCYACNPQDGPLHVWRKQIEEIRNRLIAWRDTSFAGADCNNVWCVPPASCLQPGGGNPPGGLGPESNTFDSNANGTRGDFADVVACLNWNINDEARTSDGVTAVGNAQKFWACRDACNAVAGDPNSAAFILRATELCADSARPRSLVPGFDSVVFNTPIVGSVNDCAAGSVFMTTVEQSAREAENQVAKFRQRYNFLNSRLTELNNAISILDRAATEFNEFLTCADGPDADSEPDGAACRLIKARMRLDAMDRGLPYHAIYGWQSKPEDRSDDGTGGWHIVRVDGRVPGKCDRACNIDQTPTGDPLWPRVKTRTNGSRTKRIYELEDTDGTAKMRVTRYDEPGTFNTIMFPNGVELWQPRVDRDDRRGTATPDNIERDCGDQMLPDPCPGPELCPPPEVGDYYYGAFLLNKLNNDNVRDPWCVAECPPGDTNCQDQCPIIANNNVACWELTNRLLSQGVTSERCVRYYFHDGTPYGMDFKFVPCRQF